MSVRSVPRAIRLPLYEEAVSPVRILDAAGRLVRIVAAEEFRSSETVATRRRRERPPLRYERAGQ